MKPHLLADQDGYTPVPRRRITEKARRRAANALDIAWAVILLGACGGGLVWLVLSEIAGVP